MLTMCDTFQASQLLKPYVMLAAALRADFSLNSTICASARFLEPI
jgi:hypothetical protein